MELTDIFYNYILRDKILESFNLAELYALYKVHDKFKYIIISYIKQRQNNGMFEEISINNNVDEDFISAFADNINWKLVSQRTDLSYKFIIKYSSRLDWHIIGRCHTLPESFMRTFNKYIIWQNVDIYKLSYNFIKEFRHKLDSLQVARYKLNKAIHKIKNKLCKKHSHVSKVNILRFSHIKIVNEKKDTNINTSLNIIKWL